MNKRKHSLLQGVLCGFGIGILTVESCFFLSDIPIPFNNNVVCAAETTSAPSITALFMKYVGKEITEPVTLSQKDFVVTAMYEDGSLQIIRFLPITMAKPPVVPLPTLEAHNQFFIRLPLKMMVEVTRRQLPILHQVLPSHFHLIRKNRVTGSEDGSPMRPLQMNFIPQNASKTT